MEVRRAGGRKRAPKKGREPGDSNNAAARAASPGFRQCRLGNRKERLSCMKEPLETVTYSNALGKLGLRGAALFEGLDCGSRYGRDRTGICTVKADQDLIGGVLQPRVGFVQLASGLARQLAELVTVGHV